jgi:hypothetical protein
MDKFPVPVATSDSRDDDDDSLAELAGIISKDLDDVSGMLLDTTFEAAGFTLWSAPSSVAGSVVDPSDIVEQQQAFGGQAFGGGQRGDEDVEEDDVARSGAVMMQLTGPPRGKTMPPIRGKTMPPIRGKTISRGGKSIAHLTAIRRRPYIDSDEDSQDSSSDFEDEDEDDDEVCVYSYARVCAVVHSTVNTYAYCTP